MYSVLGSDSSEGYAATKALCDEMIVSGVNVNVEFEDPTRTLSRTKPVIVTLTRDYLSFETTIMS
jgi:hypothetical protein